MCTATCTRPRLPKYGCFAQSLTAARVSTLFHESIDQVGDIFTYLRAIIANAVECTYIRLSVDSTVQISMSSFRGAHLTADSRPKLQLSRMYAEYLHGAYVHTCICRDRRGLSPGDQGGGSTSFCCRSSEPLDWRCRVLTVLRTFRTDAPRSVNYSSSATWF
jgi:hypothetical protein